MKHTSHPDIIKRLKRAEGHLRSLIGMIEAERPCLELAQQLHAIEHDIGNAKRELIHDHMEHCLDEKAGTRSNSARAALREFKALAKYL
jgi:DNA-binding FrmR family transcriptional regulator